MVNTTVGYTQGHTVRPSYEEVCSGRSGHAEAVAVEYDESVVSYEQLVHVFWERLGEWALTEKRVRNDVSQTVQVLLIDNDMLTTCWCFDTGGHAVSQWHLLDG